MIQPVGLEHAAAELEQAEDNLAAAIKDETGELAPGSSDWPGRWKELEEWKPERKPWD